MLLQRSLDASGASGASSISYRTMSNYATRLAIQFTDLEGPRFCYRQIFSIPDERTVMTSHFLPLPTCCPFQLYIVWSHAPTISLKGYQQPKDIHYFILYNLLKVKQLVGLMQQALETARYNSVLASERANVSWLSWFGFGPNSDYNATRLVVYHLAAAVYLFFFVYIRDTPSFSERNLTCLKQVKM